MSRAEILGVESGLGGLNFSVSASHRMAWREDAWEVTRTLRRSVRIRGGEGEECSAALILEVLENLEWDVGNLWFGPWSEMVADRRGARLWFIRELGCPPNARSFAIRNS